MSIEHSPERQGRLLDEYCTRAELADELGVGVRTLARYDGLREGPPKMMLAGKIYYHRASAREWLLARLSGQAAA